MGGSLCLGFWDLWVLANHGIGSVLYPKTEESEDSPDRYQVTHPSPARFVSPHPVEKERAQASIHVQDDNSFGVAHQTRAVPRLP